MTAAPDPLQHALRQCARQSAGKDEPRCRALLSFMATSNRLQTLLRQTLSQQKLTETGFKLLSVLSAHDPRPLAPTQLAADAAMWPPTVTDVLTRLELSGLIARERSHEDRRQVLAQLTPAGRKKYTAAISRILSTMIDLAAPLEGADISALRTTCDTLDSRIATLTTPGSPRPLAASAN
ncbi:MarR family transcriptional regulator [Opitutaceae bacterium TAV4]|nr:MarR family transcriptional regulator [Opitutaceae bacterium TAV4]RRJ99943.1 MarR family transcriptional regulator [Opitutaceae bacterium TAV3]